MSDIREEGVVTGTIVINAAVSGTVNIDQAVSGSIKLPELVPWAKRYDGEYVITPLAHDNQVLETNNKLLTDDVTVLKVPYFETSNLHGNTVYIASEV